MNRPGILCILILIFSDVSVWADNTTLFLLTPSHFFVENDTLPPVFSQTPQNRMIPCNDPGEIQKLTNWFTSNGSAQASDNSDSVQILSLLTLEEAIEMYEFSKDSLCGQTGRVSVGFYALDSCLNSSLDTFYAEFFSFDNVRPQLIKAAADYNIVCDTSAQDQLIAWIDSIGGARVSDQCSESVEWFTFRWVDKFQNAGAGVPGSGPYITIQSNTCDWFVEVTFLARDECGNQQLTSATFNIIDTIPPSFLDPPEDTVVNCSFEIPEPELYAFDNCLGAILANLSVNSTQSENPEECAYYNYTITRSWTVEDGCGFAIQHSQIIEVIDTLSPSFIPPEDINLYCPSAIDTSITGYPLDIEDDCDLLLEISYSDSEILVDCERVITRFWQITDACGSASITPQTITIRDTTPPVLLAPPESQVLMCNVNTNFDSLFLEWVSNAAYASATEECSSLDYFVAVPGSFTIDQPNTFPGIPVDSLDRKDCLETESGMIWHEEIEIVFFDECMNAISVTSSFTVLDTIAPEILKTLRDTILSADSISCSRFIELSFPQFTDNCELPSAIQRTLYLDGSPVTLQDSVTVFDTTLLSGMYSIIYEVEDCGGNVSSLSTTIVINDGIPPVIQCPQNMTSVTDPVDCSGTVELPINFFLEDNCGLGDSIVEIYTQGASVIERTIMNLNSEPLSFPFGLGETEVFYVTSDLAGNSGSCSFLISITDGISPEVICKRDTIQLELSGMSEFNTADLQILDTLFDNCTIAQTTFVPEIINCSGLGTNTQVRILAEDAAGNTGECTAEVYTTTTDLSPGYVSGICIGDTLRLLSNVQLDISGGNYEIQWTGPNGFQSGEKDPFIPSASSDNSGLYQLHITNPGGCIFSGSVEVTVQNLSSPQLEVSHDVHCLGDEVVLTLSGNSGDLKYDWYSGVYPDGTLVQSGASNQYAVSPDLGLYEFYAIASNNSCSSPQSNQVSVTIVERPAAEVQDLFLTLCEGDSIDLNAMNIDPEHEYKWEGPNGYVYKGPEPPPIYNIGLDNQGFYLLTSSSGSCVSDTVSTQVVVFEKPDKPVIDGEDIYCPGSFIILSVNNVLSAFEYQWYQDNELFSVQNTNTLIIPNASSNFEGTWKVLVNDGLCNSDTSDAIDIIVEDALAIGASSNSPVCEIESIFFSASTIPGADYNWAGPGGFSSDLQNPVAEPVAGEYSLTITSNTGCIQTTTTNVVVQRQPVITALSNSATHCTGGGEDLMLVPTIFPPDEYEYTWMGPNDFTSTASNPVIENYSSIHNGTYILEVSNGACLSEQGFTLVNVTDIPEPVEITSRQMICNGDILEITIVDNSAGITEFLWSTPKGQFSTTVPDFSIQNARLDDNGSYSVRVSRAGCISEFSNSLEISIVQNPVTPAASAQSSVCAGSDLQFSTPPVPGANYEWSGPNGFTANTRNPVIFNVTELYEGSYAVRILINNCVSAWSEPIQVEVIDIPEAPEAINEDLRICENSNNVVTLCVDEGSSSPGASFQWVTSEMEIFGESNSSCLTVENINNLKIGRNELFAIKKVGNCFSNPSSHIVITIDSIPQITADAGADKSQCDQDLLTLEARLEQGIEGMWRSPNEVNIVDPADPNTFVSGLDEGTNIFIWSLSSGNCRNFSSDTVFITTEREPDLQDDQFILDYNEQISFNAFVNDILPLNYELSVIQDVPGVEYHIEENGAFEFDPGPNFVGVAEFVYEVCSISCPEYCDMATITFRVGDQLDCFAPNIITPNSDGVNDHFIIPCLESGIYPSNSMIIFNQWGHEVFSAAPYRNNWGGTYKGELLPQGTYFYVLELGNGSEALNGFILLEQ